MSTATQAPSRRAFLATLAATAPAAAIPALAFSESAQAGEIDYGAILSRVEQMIETLRTSYVGEGFALDQADANRVLRYFQQRVAGVPDDEQEWEFVVDFVGSNGQSLDWIFRGDPAVMICRGAAAAFAPAAIAESVQAASDPIFAAIERHRAAFAAFEGCDGHSDAEVTRLGKANWKAEDGLIDVIPTSLAGVLALLEHVVAHERQGHEWPNGYEDDEAVIDFDKEHGIGWERLLHRNVAKALRTIHSQRAGV